MTFVAPNLACGEARGGRIPFPWGCNRRATTLQAKFGATRRAPGLFRPDFVARSSQIHCGICSSFAPRLAAKSLAANVTVFMFMTTELFIFIHCALAAHMHRGGGINVPLLYIGVSYPPFSVSC